MVSKTPRHEDIPVHTHVLHHADLWSNGDMAPRILNLGTR